MGTRIDLSRPELVQKVYFCRIPKFQGGGLNLTMALHGIRALRWVCGRPKYCEVLLNDNSLFGALVASSTGTVLISPTLVVNDRPVPSRYPEYRFRFLYRTRKVPILWFSVLQNTGTQAGLILQLFSRSVSNDSSEGRTSDQS